MGIVKCFYTIVNILPKHPGKDSQIPFIIAILSGYFYNFIQTQEIRGFFMTVKFVLYCYLAWNEQ